MRRIRNLAGLSDAAIDHFAGFLEEASDVAIAKNLRKKQIVFETWFEGQAYIVKRYLHKAAKHRVAAFFRQSNADRYCATANFLMRQSFPVAAPVMTLTQGKGLLPDYSLFVMERVEGEMLSSILTKIEERPEKRRILAQKIAGLIMRLHTLSVVHRDLNTKNFLITDTDVIHLIDFDYASRHQKQTNTFEWRHGRDVECFLSTCHGAPLFADEVRSYLLK